MSGDGYIRAHRSLFDTNRRDFLASYERKGWWLDLCQLAQHRTYTRGGHVLKRGEICVSVRFLGKRWGVGIATVSRFLGECKGARMIGTGQRNTLGTVYTVLKYDDYQHTPGEAEHPNGTRSGTEAERERNEYEEPKNLEEKKSDLSPSVETQPRPPRTARRTNGPTHVSGFLPGEPN